MKLKFIREGSTSSKRSLDSAFAVYEVMKFLQEADREEFHALHLDAKNRILATELLAVGTLTNALIHPREIFKGAVLNNSAAIILVHNHPSGDPTPSREDLLITERLSQVGSLIGINVNDHVVIGSERKYHSIRFDSNKPSISAKKSEPQKANREAKIADVKNMTDDIEEIIHLLKTYPETKASVLKILKAREEMRQALKALSGAGNLEKKAEIRQANL